ncbi:SpoIIE family protein phosphatase [Brucepastera parasyntrophica]|uniref:SpoIIE family protein phosphatase n=1 Tax=Brucepastera parasyntrophica TaxID=2880008 RepID=UPI00210EB4EC|nr:SpoIIE family protein phosphatase [Brucepastera parasyntrophica]ULQ60673.1 SpoIIE family protein phosphatase [Brucepastera parasyntrophica]
MKTTTEKTSIRKQRIIKSYPNSIQKLAENFEYAYSGQNMLEIADALALQEEIKVLCIVDEKQRPVGIVRRENLFQLLGKPFGRDLLKKCNVSEIAGQGLVIQGNTNIFAAAEMLASYKKACDNDESIYIILTGHGGTFSGILSEHELSGFMAGITNRDIETARVLQERLLENTDNISILNIRADAWSRPAKGVGGDFYYIKNIGENRFFGALCDVSGKGVAASLVVSMVWGFLRAYDINRGLKSLLSALNTAIISTFHLEKYVTGFFFIYDSEKSRLSIADMGHAHSVIIRKSADHPLTKTKGNLPLGIEQDIDPVIYAFGIQPEDALLVYSDGIPEQENQEGEEFGETRIVDFSRQCIKSGEKLSQVLPEALDIFRTNTPQHDDMTFLFFQF